MASNAEQDLTSILYTDSGIYRNRQFSRADAITLQTTYDEVFILWSQELKYRANFSTVNQVVNMPVVYAKVSGVEDGKVEAYWQKIKLLLGDDTMLIPSLPYVVSGAANQFQPLAVKTLRNGRLKREEIKADRQYPFALLREELQEHMFDKVLLMLDEADDQRHVHQRHGIHGAGDGAEHEPRYRPAAAKFRFYEEESQDGRAVYGRAAVFAGGCNPDDLPESGGL